MPIPLAIGAALGTAFQVGTGIVQAVKARKARAEMEQLLRDRPEYTRPGEINRNLALAQARAGDAGFAGENALRDQTEINAANTASLASVGGDPFAAALAAQAQLDSANRQTTATGEQLRRQDEAALSQALMTSAQYTDQEFQMNTFAPWSDAVGMAQLDYRDNRQGAIRNIGGGLNQLSSLSLGMLAGGGGQAPGIDMDLISRIVQQQLGSASSATANSTMGPAQQGAVSMYNLAMAAKRGG